MDKSKWVYKKCDEVFDLFMGKTPSRKDLSLWNDGSHPWVSISDMEGKYISKTKETITDKAVERMQEVPANTTIMSFKLTIGRAAITKRPLYTNEAIMAFPVKQGYRVDPNFLYYYLPNIRWARNSNRAVMGYTLNKKSISETAIAIPPLSTQHQIVSELDQLSDIISLKQQQIKEYDALAQSLFYEMFGDPLYTKYGQSHRTLGELYSITSSKRIFADEYVSQGIPFYRGKEITELSKGESVSEPLYISEKRYNEIKFKYGIPQIGDILLTAVGTIGNLWIVNNEKPFYFKDGNIIWLHPKEKLDSVFFRILLTIIIDKFKESLSNGAAYKALTIQNLCKVKVEVPPLTLQHSFAEKVQAIEHQKQLLKQSMAETQTLLDSRMQEYFG